jgi:hypothetical protein
MLTVIAAGISTLCFAQRTPRWQQVEADNGAIFRVALDTIVHTASGGAIVTVLEGPADYPGKIEQFSFDCRGGYWIVDERNMHTGMTYIPRRSVLAQISAIACGGAKDDRGAGAKDDRGPGVPAAPNPPTSRLNEKTEPVPRWGMQLTANYSESEAWATYRLIQKQYAALIGDREPIVIRSRGIGLGFTMRYNIRIADDDRVYLEKLCHKLIEAGGACVVLRNDRE